MEFASPSGRQEELAGRTLVVPGCSIGNLGQLAVDLFVSTCEPRPAGQLLSPSLLPCFGGDAYSEGAGVPSTELQVFASPALAVVQQRAPAALGREAAFAAELARWAAGAKVKQVVLLASIDAAMRRGPQLQGSQLRFLTNSEPLGAACERLGFLRLEGPGQGEPAYEAGLLPPWPLLRALRQEGLPTVLLTRFTSEGGGNLADAAELVSYAYALLRDLGAAEGEPVADWKAPVSWRHLFGAQQRTAIY